MTFLAKYELHFVSTMKTKSQKVCGDSEEEISKGWIPPAEIGLNCCKKLYTVRKKLVDFSLLINFTVRKCICKVLGD